MANGRPLPLLLLPFLLLCLDHGALRVAAQQSLLLNTVPAALPLPEGTAAVVLKAQIAAPLGVDCVFDLTIEVLSRRFFPRFFAPDCARSRGARIG